MAGSCLMPSELHFLGSYVPKAEVRYLGMLARYFLAARQKATR